MTKPDSPEQLAIDILKRSICHVKVGATVTDAGGSLISWGWNNVGSGFGQHAEVMAIERANRKRLWWGSIYVASTRGNQGKAIISKPCEACQFLIDKYNMDAYYRGADDKWHKVRRVV